MEKSVILMGHRQKMRILSIVRLKRQQRRQNHEKADYHIRSAPAKPAKRQIIHASNLPQAGGCVEFGAGCRCSLEDI